MILFNDVAQDPIIADPEPMEGVRDVPDRLHGLAPDPPGLRDIRREVLKSPAELGSHLRWQPLEGANGRRRQLDFVGLQSRFFRWVARPFA